LGVISDGLLIGREYTQIKTLIVNTIAWYGAYMRDIGVAEQ